ncbi:MAG: Pterin 4 alpha carbinolamine dehydratase [Candidatus Adlerbacteria bacterium]|nr:Pterin 4 alpha carbinolamine dehydratase [Candidatus Adlerbacteria bacterium]
MEEKLHKRKCKPCEGGVAPLIPEKSAELLKELDPSWMLIDGGRILATTYTFKDFVETINFVNKIAVVAEEEGHHPDLTISYNTLSIELMTHAIGGLSENDFILAAKIDELKK